MTDLFLFIPKNINERKKIQKVKDSCKDYRKYNIDIVTDDVGYHLFPKSERKFDQENECKIVEEYIDTEVNNNFKNVIIAFHPGSGALRNYREKQIKLNKVAQDNEDYKFRFAYYTGGDDSYYDFFGSYKESPIDESKISPFLNMLKVRANGIEYWKEQLGKIISIFVAVKIDLEKIEEKGSSEEKDSSKENIYKLIEDNKDAIKNIIKSLVNNIEIIEDRIEGKVNEERIKKFQNIFNEIKELVDKEDKFNECYNKLLESRRIMIEIHRNLEEEVKLEQ